MGGYQYRHESQHSIYNALNDQYLAFEELCAEHPKVDCFDVPLKNAQSPSDEGELRWEGAIFASLLSLLERAYVFYQVERAPDPSVQRPPMPSQRSPVVVMGFAVLDTSELPWDTYARAHRRL